MSESSNPPPRRPGHVRPMTALGALGWTFLATFTLALLAAFLHSLRGSVNLVTLIAAQAIAYGLTLFAILRVYARDHSIRAYTGLRLTSAPSYALAFLLGVAVSFPLTKLQEIIVERFPMRDTDDIAAELNTAAPGRLAVIIFGMVVLGPFVEEILFRGALFTALRAPHRATGVFSLPFLSSGDEPPSGSSLRPPPTPVEVSTPPRTLEAVVVSTVLFTLIHLHWQVCVPIAIAAVMLAFLRVRSGSLLVSFAMHAGFNAMPFFAASFAPDLEAVPWTMAAGGAGVSVLLLGALVFLFRGGEAERARSEEPS
ncbi:MAG: type II CAAX endopeptidase family protein [Polyangiaceae bacterium]